MNAPMRKGKCPSVPRGIPKSTRDAVFERDGEQCRYCGKSEGPFHLDHVLPWSRGGLHTEENLVVSCQRCNVMKGGKTPDEMGWRLRSIGAAPCPGRKKKAPKRKAKKLPKWWPFASSDEVMDLARLDSEISDIKREILRDTAERDVIARRCEKRMQRAGRVH